MSALDDYYEKYGHRITQPSERLFLEDFLYPLVGSQILDIEPQYPFIDRTGRARRIDFAYNMSSTPIALEVNGESYHAEGIIPMSNSMITCSGRTKYFARATSSFGSPTTNCSLKVWRPVVMDALRDTTLCKRT